MLDLFKKIISKTLDKSALNSLSASISIVDKNGDIIQVNDRWRDFSKQNDGEPEKTDIGTNYFEVCKKTEGEDVYYAKKILEGMKKVQKGKTAEFAMEYPCHSPNTNRWFIARVTPYNNLLSHKIIVSHENITDRKKSELALTKSEQRYRLLFNQMLDAFALHEIICDQNDNPIDYRFITVNPAFTAVTGLKPEDVIARTVREVLPNTENEWINKYGEVALTGKNLTFEMYAREFDKYFEVSAFQTKYREFAAIFKDITPRIYSQKENQTLIHDMQERIKELKCLFNTTKKIQQNSDLEKLFENIVKIIPPGWQFPEITTAKIIFDDKQYLSPDFQKSKWKLSQNIIVDNESRGKIEVFYKKQMPEFDIGPFLQQEKDLLETISVLLTQSIKSKEIQNELVKSKNLLDTAGKIAKIGGWEHDIRTGQAVWTKPLYDILEVDPDKPPHSMHEFSDYYPQPYKDIIKKTWKNIIENHKSFDIEAQRRTDKGRLIWARITGEPVIENNECVKIRGAFQDITSQKQALEQLERSEQLLNETGRMAMIGGWEHDLKTGKATWTKALYDIIEIPYDDHIPGRYEYPSFFPEGWDRKIITQNYDKAVNENIPFDITTRCNTATGKTIWARTTGEPVVENGECIKIRGTFQDVTNLKMVQQQVESLSKFPSENPYPVMRISSDGKILYHNKASQDLLEYWRISDNKTLGETEKINAEKACNLQKIITQQVRCYLNDFLLRYVPVEDENYVNVYAMDITKLVEAQKQIQQINTELEDRVKQRTSQLQAVNKELEAFAYSVSHDLRTPLRAIDGFSSALVEDCRDYLDQTGKDYLQRIRKATNNMANLIDDVLTLSRISRRDMTYKKLNLSKIAKDIADQLQISQPNRKVNWKIQPDITAKGDPVLLKIMLQNLLENSWKFTSKHETANIQFGKFIEDHQNIFFVKDDGAGFDMQYLNKLFTAFQRLHQKHEFPGTGIGLATVQRIINRHGGKIWCESQVEKGACFYFILM